MKKITNFIKEEYDYILFLIGAAIVQAIPNLIYYFSKF